MIVDEFTGRVTWSPLERWPAPGVGPKRCRFRRNPGLASITYQNFFLLYPRLAGMTGTAKAEEVEFEDYCNETTIVPTNRVRARQDWADQVYKAETAKWRAVAEKASCRTAGTGGHDVR